MSDASPPGDDTPAISVVISTYNRGSMLADAVRSVLAQDPAGPPLELIVVDNNSTDGTRALVAELAREDARLRYVFEGRQGVSYGRNAGIAAARASIVAFTDDDVRARPDWTTAIARTFAEHPEAAFIGGRVLPRWPAEPPAWLTREHWSPLALLDHGDRTLRIDPARPITLVTCNAAFRRAALERVGGFDPRFQPAGGLVTGCEDQELEMRVMRAGGVGLYVPDLVMEAEVQPKRLTRAHHRRWHRDHGRVLVALLGERETFDRDMQAVRVPPGRPMPFGAAPWAYRGAITSALRAVGARLLGRADEAFRHECAFQEAAGHIAACAERRKRQAGPGPVLSHA